MVAMFGLPGGGNTTAGAAGESRRHHDDDDDRDDGWPEDLALSPEHSPASSDHGSVDGSDGPGPDAKVDAVVENSQQQEQDQKQTAVPYIKTLEEIYRIVDSLTSSPVNALDNNNATTTTTTTGGNADDARSDAELDSEFRSSHPLMCEDFYDVPPARIEPEVAVVEPTLMLKDTTDVPVPEVLVGWKEGDGRVVVVVPERVGGGGGGAMNGDVGGNGYGDGNGRRTGRLYDFWWELGTADRERVARQVAGYAEQWRGNHSDAISSVSGYPIVRGYEVLLSRNLCDDQDSVAVAAGGDERGFPHCRSNIEVLGAIEERLTLSRRRGPRQGQRPKKKKLIITDDDDDDDEDEDEQEETMRVLKEYMPESYPCVLAHGDLSTRNILVEITDDSGGTRTGRGAIVKVMAILGFENAASLPVWAEGGCARFCDCREDEQWKALLSRYLPVGWKPC